MAKKKTKTQAPKILLLDAKNLDPHQVLPFKYWIQLAGISRATGWRILHDGTGPKMIKLSERRVGVAVKDHVKWVDGKRGV